ncbi:MAG: Uma2 family endonuclease [Candidatus Rokubacteria bacterium]|nr:Uma2 family endonuclease [Candidatus Rokubacteria bacterium]
MNVVLTYRDYAALPNDGKRYEIHDGELSVTPAPGTRHQRVIGALFAGLRAHVIAHGLGEVFVSPFDVILSNSTIVQPDITFVAAERSRIVSERGLEEAPTLAVEILSPSTAHIDRSTKLQLYARYAVPYYWIVDPEARSMEIYVLESGAYGGAQRRSGDPLVDLPPFAGLTLDATTSRPSYGVFAQRNPKFAPRTSRA